LRKPPPSIQAIEPPPAEIVVMSSAGTSTCRRAIMPSVTSSGVPPSMNAISAEVPPMSRVTRPRPASSRASQALACAPAAGPENSVCTVRPPAIAAENGMTPPFDCIRKRCSVPTPAASRPPLRWPI
jgi:hypothetical protein